MRKTMFKVALVGANARMSSIARLGRVALAGAMVVAATLAACSDDEDAKENGIGITGVNVKDADGNTYRTKVYNGVEWMIDNSKKTTGVTGCDNAPIDITQIDEVDYGYLYSWSCAAKACPAGWSLPTDEDFTALESALNAGGDVAWADWNTGSSLAGIGGGGSYGGSQGSSGYWWSSSSSNRYWFVLSGNASGSFNTRNSSYSFSVRCRKSQ
jgi:hypothetical protein